MTLAFTYIDKAGFRPDIAHPVGAGLKPASTTTPRTTEAQAGMRSKPSRAYCARAGSTSDRIHPVEAGFRPAITHPVGAGLKPAPTTTPHTTEDRLHLCEYATIQTTPGAGDGDSNSSQVKRFQAQEVLFGKLRPYPAKITCPKRNGVSVGESGRTHPVEAGFRPAITRGVGAGLKPAPTTAPHTAEDRLHLCKNAPQSSHHAAQVIDNDTCPPPLSRLTNPPA